MRPHALFAIALILAGCAGNPPAVTTTSTGSDGGPAIALEAMLDGLSQPVFMTQDAASGVFFVVEQTGRVVALSRDGQDKRTFLDVSGAISRGGERGLLGFALHPDFGQGDGRFYIDYTETTGDTRVDEYQLIGDVGDASSLPVKTRTLLAIEQPNDNHNGGMLAFGPDGLLYIGMGDGGTGADGNGQDLDVLLGKILRIDVGPPEDARGGVAYRAPPDNPFVGRSGRDEIWDFGLRNPWRFSFDRTTGDLWIGDVGQNNWEEIDLEAAGRGGNNYGWNAFEGTHVFDPLSSAPGAVDPVAQYDHKGERCSVTGGYMYRGAAHPELAGTYLYGDYCTGTIWGLRQAAGAWTPAILLESGLNISSFAEDAAGEIYVIDHGGAIHHVIAPAT